MRMWQVNPAAMCRQHLLGEHVEIHMLVGTINKGRSIQGFVDKGLVEIDSLQSRHDALVSEMGKRGYNHASTLPAYRFNGEPGSVDSAASYRELLRRCSECRKLEGGE